MQDLKRIRKQSLEEVTRHTPEFLSDFWPEGKAFFVLSTVEPPATSRSRLTLSVEAVIDMAECGLNYNLGNLRKGLIAVVRAERNIPPDEPVALDALTMLAFSLGASMQLVDEWVEALSEAVAPYQDRKEASFTIVDAAHSVLIDVEERSVVRVRPPKAKRK